MDSEGTRVDIESGRLHGRRDVSPACLISFICNCKGFELLFNPKKRALAAFFVILEAISSFLDGFQKSQRIIRIVAFLLSVLGFLMTVLTGISERNSMANRVQAEKQLGAVEIGFSVVQLIATFMALLGTEIMNNYMSSILLVFFAVIAYGFTFVKDEGGSDTSGVENSTSSIELLHIASTPNEIGEHSDLANTSNEMDDTEISQPLLSMLMNIENIVFLMGLISTWILQAVIESLMSVSLIRISILQDFLVMELMSILAFQALVMRVMIILALRALVMRVMSILVLRALVMRVMRILVLRALVMRVMNILALQALVMRVMRILVLRALVMRVMRILALQALLMRVMRILVLRAIVMRVMSILALQALVVREMSILALQALVMREMSILAWQALVMREMSILVLRALVMRVMSILVLRALVVRVISILALRALVMNEMTILVWKILLFEMSFYIWALEALLMALRALVMALRALVMGVMSICILALRALVMRVMSLLVWQVRVMRVLSIWLFQGCVIKLMSMLVLRALGKGLMSMLVSRALGKGWMLYKIDDFIVLDKVIRSYLVRT